MKTFEKERLVQRVLPGVQMPAQYLGGEVNMVRKAPAAVHGRLCLAFPDVYTIGMSHHGLQILYSLMNDREDWACERVFTPWGDMEQALRREGLPLYSLETFTPLAAFDVLGFSVQYELGYANILTMLDLGGIPLRGADRTMDHPLVIAGGQCSHNPEPLAPFIDVFVLGDGEPSLPQVCDLWLRWKQRTRRPAGGQGRGGEREAGLLELAATLPFCYVPRFYQPEYRQGRFVALAPTQAGGARVDRTGRSAGIQSDPDPHSANCPVRGVRARSDRDRDHARMSVAVPLLPEFGDQAPRTVPGRRDHRPGSVGELSPHRVQ